MLPQKYRWLDWSDGATNSTIYMKSAPREKDVYLKINNHSPEKLKKIIRKRSTNFGYYLKSGKIGDPYIKKDPRDMYHETMHEVNVLLNPVDKIPDYRPERHYRKNSI